jgi:hypothetical protein
VPADFLSYLLREADEISSHVFGTEKKTPSLFEAGYNFELSPHALKLMARASEMSKGSERLIWRFSRI